MCIYCGFKNELKKNLIGCYLPSITEGFYEEKKTIEKEHRDKLMRDCGW